MTKIEAYLQPVKLEVVIAALSASGNGGVTVTNVKGCGGQPAPDVVYRGIHYLVDFAPRVKLEVICVDGDADDVVSLIVTLARTGKVGDGKIFISRVQHVVRIRNGQIDEAAL